MKDINGIKIKIGDKVKTQQYSGGLFSPAPAKIGIVEPAIDAFGNSTFKIRFRNPMLNYDQFILLDGKINEIVS